MTNQLQAQNLTAKQEAFCYGILQGKTQAEAYRMAYDCENALPETIWTEASLLMDNPKVSQKIAELRAKVDDRLVMGVTERKRRLSEIARADLSDFVLPDGNIDIKKSGALADFTVRHGKEGSTKHVGLRDPIAAIQELNKMERIYADTNSERPAIVNLTYNFNQAPGGQAPILPALVPQLPIEAKPETEKP